MKKIISVFTSLCIALTLFIPISVFAANETDLTQITVKSVDIFKTDGEKLTYLSRYSDQFNVRITLDGAIPAKTYASLDSQGAFYNNSSTSTANNKVEVTANKTFSFNNVKYSGTGTTIKFTLFTDETNQITFDKSVEILEEDPAAEDVLPRFLVDSYTFGNKTITAGSDFTLKFTLKNLNAESAQKAVLNIKSSAEAILKSGTTSLAQRTIDGRGTTEYSLKFNLPATAQNSTQIFSFTLDYQYLDYDLGEPTAGSFSFSISIPVERITRINLTEIDAPDSISIGEKGEIGFKIVNSGYVSVNNAVINLLDKNGKIVNSKYIGTLGKSSQLSETIQTSEGREAGDVKYTLSLTYEDDNLKTTTITQNVTIKVIQTAPLKIQQIKYNNQAAVGQDTKLTFNLVNTGKTDYSNVQASVLNSNNKEIYTKFIGKVTASAQVSDIEMIFNVDKESDNSYTLVIAYESAINESLKLTEVFTIKGIKGDVLKIQQLEYPAQVITGRNAIITFNVVNTSDENYHNLQAIVTDDKNKQITTYYIGEIAARSQVKEAPVEIKLDKEGTNNLTLTLQYDNSSNDTSKITQSIQIKAIKSSNIKIQRLTYPATLSKEANGDISFDIVNSGIEPFYNVEAIIYNEDNKVVTSKYIGEIAARSQQENVVLSFNFKDAGNKNLKLQINYESAIGELKNLLQQFSLKVSDTTVSDDGSVKIQRVDVPINSLKETKIQIPFTVTNTRLVEITAVEAFLYDGSGNEIDSLFIGKITPQSSFDSAFSTFYENSGYKNCIIKIKYTDDANKIMYTERSFGFDVDDEATEGPAQEKPANIKIQKLSAPSQIYVNVPTNIPYIITNAGKGKAYNAEVYITDENGTEYAREYIGTISESASMPEMVISVKFKEINTYNLIFNVYYEDYEENTYLTQKAFEQKVVPYRLTIKDVVGYEWLYTFQEATIEFAILNQGSQTLLNCNAKLVDDMEIEYANIYIGNIDPGVEKARQKFKVNFMEPGEKNLRILFTYENADMYEFSTEYPMLANIQEIIYDYPVEPIPDGGEFPIEGEENKGMSKTVLVAIIAGATVIVIAGIVIAVVLVRRKKRKLEDDDDMDFFFNQNKVDVANIGNSTSQNQGQSTQNSDKK